MSETDGRCIELSRRGLSDWIPRHPWGDVSEKCFLKGNNFNASVPLSSIQITASFTSIFVQLTLLQVSFKKSLKEKWQCSKDGILHEKKNSPLVYLGYTH